MSEFADHSHEDALDSANIQNSLNSLNSHNSHHADDALRASADDPTRLLNESATIAAQGASPSPGATQAGVDDETPAELTPLVRLLTNDATTWRATLPSDALLAQLARMLPGSMENTAPHLAIDTGIGQPLTPTRTPVSQRKPLRLTRANPGVSGVLATGQRAFLGALAATVVVVLLATLFTALAARSGRGPGLGGHPTASATGITHATTPTTPATTAPLGQPGTVYWKYHTGDILYGAPAVANGVVYLASTDADLYALDARTGSRLWATRLGATIDASPVVGDGYVYLAPIDGYLYGLRTSDGSIAWRTNINNGVDNGGTTPMIANGVVYIGSQDGQLYAVNGRSGRILWSYPTSGLIYDPPVAVNGVLYFCDQQHLFALRTDGHTLLWQVPAQGYGVAVAGETLYVSGGSSTIGAYSLSDGHAIWTKQPDSQPQDTLGAPTVGDGLVYFPGGGGVYALDAQTGAQRWFFVTGGNGVVGRIAVANGVAYFGAGDYYVYAVGARSGKERWSYLTSNQVQAGATVANGLVYIGSFDYFLYAIIA